MTIKADKYNWNRVKFCRKITIFKMSTRNFLRVAEFSTRNLDIPTRILLVLYSNRRVENRRSCGPIGHFVRRTD